MFGLYTVRKAFLLSVLMVPLALSTLYTMYFLSSVYLPLSRYINLSQAAEVIGDGTARATGSPDSPEGGAGGETPAAPDVVEHLRQGHPAVTSSQQNLNRGRYGHQGDGIYAVAKVRVSCSPVCLRFY